MSERDTRHDGEWEKETDPTRRMVDETETTEIEQPDGAEVDNGEADN